LWPHDLTLGPLAVNLYGALTALGALAGLWILRFSAPPCGIGIRYARDFAFWTLVWGLVGSRAAYVALHWGAFAGRPWRILDIWSGGLMFQGGILGALLAACATCRLRGSPLAPLADALAPALSLGQALGRAGCLSFGCCYGRPAPPGFPLALTFPPGGGAPPGWPLYPVQAMEGAGLLALTGILFLLYRLRGRPRGMVTGAYLLGAGLLRLWAEGYRGDFRGAPLLGLPPTSWAAIFTAACGLALLACLGAVRIRKRPLRPPAPEGRRPEGPECP
jgi:phosphatidylglycerol:prolipoprotein diacylglycerol transferase